MSVAPVEPTPPADPATDPATPPAPPADPATPPVVDPPADPDPTDDSDPRVKRANAQAAQYRVQLRAQETKVAELEGTLAKLAAALNPGATETDPAQQAATATAEAERVRTEAAQLKAELQVHNLAAEAGANAVKLLDSRRFTDKLHGLDPAADDYTDQVSAAIKDAVSKDATLSAAGQVPSRGGASGAGQGPAQPAGAVTQEQFNAMDYDARAELYRTNPDLYRRLAGTGS